MVFDVLFVGILVASCCSGSDGACSGSGCQITVLSSTIADSSATIAPRMSSSLSMNQTRMSTNYSTTANSSTEAAVSCSNFLVFSCKEGKPYATIALSFVAIGFFLGGIYVEAVLPIYRSCTCTSSSHAESKFTANIHADCNEGNIFAMRGDLVLNDRNARNAGPPFHAQLVECQSSTDITDVRYGPNGDPYPVSSGQYLYTHSQPMENYVYTEEEDEMESLPSPVHNCHVGVLEERYGPDGRPYLVFAGGARFGSDNYGGTSAPPEPGDEGQRFEPSSCCCCCCCASSCASLSFRCWYTYACLIFFIAVAQKSSSIVVLLTSPTKFNLIFLIADLLVLFYSLRHQKYVPGSTLHNYGFAIFSTACSCCRRCYGAPPGSRFKVVRILQRSNISELTENALARVY
jgi:hypothetical protein